MALKQEEATIIGTRGAVSSEVAAPIAGSVPRVRVVQAICGVPLPLHAVCNRLAMAIFPIPLES